MPVKSLDQLRLKNRRVLLRVDYNVPMDAAGAITDDSRIRASLPTLTRLTEAGSRITLMSHLGRPKGKYDPQYSMKPVADHLASVLGRPVRLVADFKDGGDHGPIQMLENLRFSPGETENDSGFAKDLARYGEVYVNDAFGAAHRAHASIAAVCEFFPERGAGLLMMKELHYLKEALENPERPFVAVLGGSKVSDKLKLIRNLLERVDALIVGGAMSYTFLKAKGIEVGDSRVEEGFLAEAKALIELCHQRGIRLLLPLDHLAADNFKEDAQAEITLDQDIRPGFMGLDIGPETINLFTETLLQAKTVVWNGPMGVFEWEAFSTGTISVAEAMAESRALTVIGGGDSVAAAYKADVANQITHISTGGGASLELLAGHELPGIKALET